MKDNNFSDSVVSFKGNDVFYSVYGKEICNRILGIEIIL